MTEQYSPRDNTRRSGKQSDPTPKNTEMISITPVENSSLQKVEEEKPKQAEVTNMDPHEEFGHEPKIMVNNITVLEENLPPRWAFFLFVNPTSGGNKASILTKLAVILIVY